MALGVEQGERVVLWATNVPEWVVLQFALAKIGAILVTANTSLRARDIDYVLRQSEAATLITIRGFRDVDYVNALSEIGAVTGGVPTLKRMIFIGDQAPAGFVPYGELCTPTRARSRTRSWRRADARSASTTSSTCNTRRGRPAFPKA